MLKKCLTTIVLIIIFIGIAGNCMAVGVETANVGQVQSMGSQSIKAGLIVGIILIVGVAVYLVPTIVAIKKKHPYKIAIILLNIFLGWTLLGWIGSLVWACILPSDNKKTNNNKYEDVERLQKLKASGAITEEEFKIEKAKTLK